MLIAFIVVVAETKWSFITKFWQVLFEFFPVVGGGLLPAEDEEEEDGEGEERGERRGWGG